MKKKLLAMLLSLSVLAGITACGEKETGESNSTEKETEEPTESENPEENLPEEETEDMISVEPEYADDSIEKEIQNYSANIIIENYSKTDIQEIVINEDGGTEEDGDYIILARLTWNVKNSGAMSKEMLEMYSSDFAARVGTDQPSVNEVAIFWTVPYLNDANAKWAYERKDNGMFLSDNMMDSVFNQ